MEQEDITTVKDDTSMAPHKVTNHTIRSHTNLIEYKHNVILS